MVSTQLEDLPEPSPALRSIAGHSKTHVWLWIFRNPLLFESVTALELSADRVNIHHEGKSITYADAQVGGIDTVTV